jgi:hypothetical protein
MICLGRDVVRHGRPKSFDPSIAVLGKNRSCTSSAEDLLSFTSTDRRAFGFAHLLIVVIPKRKKHRITFTFQKDKIFW